LPRNFSITLYHPISPLNARPFRAIRPTKRKPTPMSRIAKISRLPSALRQALHERLDQSEPAPSLLDWLNAEPSVQAVLKEQFDGHPITENKIAQWPSWAS